VINVTLKPQECNGTYKFDSQVYMTRGFQSEFGDLAPAVVFTTMAKIKERVNEGIADYFQVAECNEISFWVIDDVSHITFLLKSEY